VSRNARIIAKRQAGAKYRELQAEFGLTVGTLSDIIHGRVRPKPKRKPHLRAERDAKIVAMRETGATYTLIGLTFGLTATSIHTICAKAVAVMPTRHQLARQDYVSPIARQFLYGPAPRAL
jgi:DNA invertase Pin-like site-specific DNA recombinase